MRVAPMRSRLLAALIDASLILGGIAGVAGALLGVTVGFARASGTRGTRGRQMPGGEDERSGPGRDQGEGIAVERDEASGIPAPGRTVARRGLWRLDGGMWGAVAGLKIATRNWRTPGFRVNRLRRVDARTGGSISIPSALTDVWLDLAWRTVNKAVFGAPARRERERARLFEPELRAMRREHGDDIAALQRATAEFSAANGLDPFAGCGAQLAGLGVRIAIDALGSRGGQTLRDRLTGTMVIIER